MTREELKELYVLVVLVAILILILPIVYAFGVRFGQRSVASWETTKVHHEMSVQGYNYCPYCGEEIKRDKK